MTALRPPLAGVIGWPVGHSRSPLLHGYWLRRCGLAGYYIPIALSPEEFEAGLRSLLEVRIAVSVVQGGWCLVRAQDQLSFWLRGRMSRAISFDELADIQLELHISREKLPSSPDHLCSCRRTEHDLREQWQIALVAQSIHGNRDRLKLSIENEAMVPQLLDDQLADLVRSSRRVVDVQLGSDHQTLAQ